jgi:glutamate--cysteine ligase
LDNHRLPLLLQASPELRVARLPPAGRQTGFQVSRPPGADYTGWMTNVTHEVPHLTTAQSGPILDLEQRILDAQGDIEAWLRLQWRTTPPPFYTSVDLRNAGFKLAPVDTNLFPAGFNNLNPDFHPMCVQALQSAVERVCPTAARVLILAEDHTRNTRYFEHLATLAKLCTLAGFETRVGAMGVGAAITHNPASGPAVHIEPLRRDGDRVLTASGFDPCLLLLNNDLSAGIPELLRGLTQDIAPPLALGWSTRLKSGHFEHYRKAALELASLLGIDPWLMDPLFLNCGEINFMTREGEECLAEQVDALLARIRRQYKVYGITQQPFAVIKADAGTYGMAVMTVQDANEVTGLNRKQRTRMAASKGGLGVHRVLIQEGVHTFETWGAPAAVAEPVVYMVDRFVVGGFYRVHTGRGPQENLNAPGMHFEPLAFASCCNTPDACAPPDDAPNRFYAYGVIARLALVAAAREIHSAMTETSP